MQIDTKNDTTGVFINNIFKNYRLEMNKKMHTCNICSLVKLYAKRVSSMTRNRMSTHKRPTIDILQTFAGFPPSLWSILVKYNVIVHTHTHHGFIDCFPDVPPITSAARPNTAATCAATPHSDAAKTHTPCSAARVAAAHANTLSSRSPATPTVAAVPR